MAVPAADGITMEFLLDQLLATGPVPRWAVIEVSPETVNAKNTWWMPLHVLRQLNWEDVPTHARAAVKGNAAWPYLEARLVPTYTYRKQIVAETKVRRPRPAVEADATAAGGRPPAVVRPDSPAPQLDGDHPGPGEDEHEPARREQPARRRRRSARR